METANNDARSRANTDLQDKLSPENHRRTLTQLRHYLAPLAITVLATALVWLLPTNRDMRDTPPFIVFAFFSFLLIVVLRPLYLVFSRHPEPTKQLKHDILERWPWLVACILSGICLAQTVDMVMRIKIIIPELNPFFADPTLILMDRWIFLGNDAWAVSHSIIGARATQLLDQIYVGWHFVQVSLYVFATVIPNSRLQLQIVLAAQLCWILLGGVMATLFASVGPCFYQVFYGESLFTPLIDTLQEKGAHWALLGFSYLLDPNSGIGAGISAMPSMHISVAILVAYTVRAWLPRLQMLAWLYVTIIFIGSFHLGWHYAVDGIISAVGTVTIWLAIDKWLTHATGTPLSESDKRPSQK